MARLGADPALVSSGTEGEECCSSPSVPFRVLEECQEELLELRATLLQEHVWRQREGLV